MIEAGTERTIAYPMPYPAEDVEAIEVELADSACGSML